MTQDHFRCGSIIALGKIRQNLACGQRLQITLSPDELLAVDDVKHWMPSRAAAVRELFRLGLATTGPARDSDGKSLPISESLARPTVAASPHKNKDQLVK